LYLSCRRETYDGVLNDIYGFHVKEDMEAIENSTGGKIAEGNVGGGTGMMCLVLKAAQELLREF
jgi:L-aminopeptidase/D-esterase-like protein